MSQPAKKRRRFSFSLRTLMVFMLALCLLFGFVGRRVYRAREQQAFLRELRATGCSYDVDGSFGSNVAPTFWELVFDSNYLHRIESVSYSGDPFFDDGVILELMPLAELKNLERLSLYNTQVSDLSLLANLKNLKDLYLSGTQVSDLLPLANLKNLEWLFLSGTQVNDLSPLASLKKLEHLDLNSTQVSDLSPLAELENLYTLRMANTQVSDLTPLSMLKNLEWLDTENTQVSVQQAQLLQKALPNCSIYYDR